ncbi:hypothetical protein F511_08844 [Dorcoceras hygrometricum]|uniref:Uncharacterized protein n=1 Tax=Dorcoceras hygrometricum TaxID=472368 RepID=A0A2Z7AIH0_9LAMI|nr:hypothetical protein F511_08844 [Dorcoceras hygrometricum]
MRRRFVVATGSPAASEFGRYYLLLVFRESLRLDDVSGATSLELVATLRFEVATGSSKEREKRCAVLSCDWIPSCWFSMRRRLNLRFRIASTVVEEARCVEPENFNAIIGVVTTGFECLPPSCDGLTGPEDHGPMIYRLIHRGSSGNQAGQSGGSAGRSPFP